MSAEDPGTGPRWLLVLDDDHEGPPRIVVDHASRLITSRAKDVDGLFESLNLFHTALRDGGAAEAVDCDDVDEVVERVVDEVADTYPGFALRGLDWDEICARHVDAVRSAEDPLPALQRWLAELQDGHTWAWAPRGNLPYSARVEGAAVTLVRVPERTRGHEAGARAGWTLAEVDGAPIPAQDWLARAAAPPHARPYIAGRRLLAGVVGEPRVLTAASSDGARATWEEAPTATPTDPLVRWRRLDTGAGLLRVEAWVADRGVDELVDRAFEELRGVNPLILDLRANPGGNLLLACRTRDRFLRDRTTLGSIRYGVGGGELSEPFPLVGEPSEPARRWPGRLVCPTDALTFSSSEDFLLGLQGLEHVQVVGSPSGGGSGRPRSLRLLPSTTLMISTALTYDRSGHCVEGAGIPVDVPAAGSDDDVLALAERL